MNYLKTILIVFVLAFPGVTSHAQTIFGGGPDDLDPEIFEALKSGELKGFGEKESQGSKTNIARFQRKKEKGLDGEDIEDDNNSAEEEIAPLPTSRLEHLYDSIISTYLPWAKEDVAPRRNMVFQADIDAKKNQLIGEFIQKTLNAQAMLNEKQLLTAIRDLTARLPDLALVADKSEEQSRLVKPKPRLYDATLSSLLKQLVDSKDYVSPVSLEKWLNEFYRTAGLTPNYTQKNLNAEKPNSLTPPLSNAILEQFGYNAFNTNNPYEVDTDGIISDSYTIGPGDQIMIDLWGSTTKTHTLDVTREGYIQIPEVGKLNLGGQTYRAAKEAIKDKIGAFYQPSSPKISISLGDIRGINVFVVGEVNLPGHQSVSARHSVMSLLYLAKGPKKSGSLRNIKIKRKDNSVIHFDAYSVLMNGDPGADVTVLDGDIIHIPVITYTAAATGEVSRPGIYEILPGETLSDLISFAGGVSPNGREDQVLVLSKNPRNVGRDILEVSPKILNKHKISNGDVIAGRPIANNRNGLVDIKGQVYFPGSYPWFKGKKLSEVISQAGGATEDAYLKYGVILRHYGKGKNHKENEALGQLIKRESISFNLSDVLNKQQDLELKPKDEIRIYNRHDIQPPATVQIIGEVKNPGKYDYYNGMHAIDLIIKAGGLSSAASFETATLTRVVRKNNSEFIERQEINLRALLDRSIPQLSLMPDDEIVISKARKEFIHVKIMGEVALPATYRLKASSRLSDLLTRSQGFSEKANPAGLIFIRPSLKEKTKHEFEAMADRLEKNLMLSVGKFVTNQLSARQNVNVENLMTYQRGVVEKARNVNPTGRIILKMPSQIHRLEESLANIQLEDGDAIFVPKLEKSINVTGEVVNSNTFVWRPSATVKDYISLAGGPTAFTDLKDIYIVRSSGEVITEGNLKGEATAENDGTLVKRFGKKKNSIQYASIFPGDTIYVPQKTKIQLSNRLIFHAFLDDAVRIATLARIIEGRGSFLFN